MFFEEGKREGTEEGKLACESKRNESERRGIEKAREGEIDSCANVLDAREREKKDRWRDREGRRNPVYALENLRWIYSYLPAL